MAYELVITIPGGPQWDPVNEIFHHPKTATITLLHSLISISLWESRWHEAYLKKTKKTDEQILDYIKCMTITENVDPYIYGNLTNENLKQVANYINDSMTATVINNISNGTSKDVMTSEYMYYLMFKQNIDISCEKWHLNRLIALLKVFELKDSPPKKMSQAEIYARNAEINARNRARFKSKG